MRLGVIFYSFLDLGYRLRVIEVDLGQPHRSVHKMNMAILKARQHEPACCIDDLRRTAAKFLHFTRAANGKDLVSAYGHSLCPGLLWIHRVNACILNDCVGRIRWWVGGLQRRAEKNGSKQRKPAVQREAEHLRLGQASLSLILSTLRSERGRRVYPQYPGFA